MRDSVALQRYLQRHIEPGLPSASFSMPCWHHVLVIPAYRESPALVDKLALLPSGEGRTLVILVLNRPDSDPDPLVNAELRNLLQSQSLQIEHRETVPVVCLNAHTDLYLHDMETSTGPTPQKSGVGLARKTGFDIALQWIAAGGIAGHWICSTDADATLPGDYFEQLEEAAAESVAALFPFRHVPGGDTQCDAATALYERRLHHYVQGLRYAGSPYAYHTLGSCLAVDAQAYTQVRGFPKRAGAEDFYLLNKLAKLGPVANLIGESIQLQSRRSSRVPFGTGPAVEAIILNGLPLEETRVFDHPRCFETLRALLSILPALAKAPEQNTVELLLKQGLDPGVAEQARAALETLGLASALAHCSRQSKTSEQFARQFHQWFDAFRTLKFIHAMRDSGWPQQSLIEIDADHVHGQL